MLHELYLAYVIFPPVYFLIGIGSAYYHYAPGNDTPVSVRLPMTLGFTGLFAMYIAEKNSIHAANNLFIPLLVIGIASVIYWGAAESCRIGDLSPNMVVQDLPMQLIPQILFMHR